MVTESGRTRIREEEWDMDEMIDSVGRGLRSARM